MHGDDPWALAGEGADRKGQRAQVDLTGNASFGGQVKVCKGEDQSG